MKPLASLREELQGILAGKEYRIYYRQQQNLLLELLKRLRDWLYSILHNIFPQADVARASEFLAYGIAALGVLLVGLLAFLLFSRFVRQGRVHAKPARISPGHLPTVQRHLAEAQTLAEQGEYAAAFRSLFLGYILYLEQNRWIEAKAWKTNWEYCAELNANAPRLAFSFTSLAVQFEEATYGGRPISGDDYWLYHNQVKRWVQEEETI